MSSAYVTKSGYVITRSSASKLPATVTVSKELFDSMISREVYEALILERDQLLAVVKAKDALIQRNTYAAQVLRAM